METWPELPYDAWKETRDTLHLWTQIVGKVKLELCPFLNQWWEVTFHLTARGLNTGPIPWRGESFDVDFDFIDHRLAIRVSDGRVQEITLAPRSVAAFYRLFMDALTALDIAAPISTLPTELPNPTRFEQDTAHASYDAGFVQRWWRVMLAVSRAMERFRTPFHGKSSPVQFFWGGFDLDATRFNGKPAPPLSDGGAHHGVRGRRGEFRGRLLSGRRALPPRRPVRLPVARARRDRAGARPARGGGLRRHARRVRPAL